VTAPDAAARRSHLPEYLIEAGALATFMVSACTFGTLIGHPGSPLHQVIGSPLTQRLTMGVLMGLTLVAIVYSRFGKRSGAHMNPALTLTFLRLGKIAPRDALFYIIAQFVGGVAGVIIARAIVGMMLGHPSVRYVVTEPGPLGAGVAFGAELLIAFMLMWVVLGSAASARYARFTGLFAGLLVATFIAIESPLSGMSMNPARTLGSALAAAHWTAIWIYFTAPLLGMLLAAQAYLWRKGRAAVPCPKMAHATPCIFCEHSREAAAFAGRRFPSSTQNSSSIPGTISTESSL
jgi:aquaporin Z